MATGAKFPRSLIRARATQRPAPASGVDESQGNPFFTLPGVARKLSIPADPGINMRGFLNPFSMASYQVSVPITGSIQALPGNMRRTYLLVQNLGPGNLYINFGADAGINACHVLITTQFYEQIGGGSYDYVTNHSVPNSFVTRDYISLLADTANCFAIVTQGLWNFVGKEISELM